MIMLLYSLGLTLALVVSAPWWLVRMATTQRYRQGLLQRLGKVPFALRGVVRWRQVVWVHAVSVGEVLAASRLENELEAALGERALVVVSTTTRSGQRLARERFGRDRVFYMPLDFAWAVRPYLRALKPMALVLMESELWPRMLHECSLRGVPVVVVNARVSDRSFARGMKLRVVWGRALRMVNLWLAQSEEDARRLVAMGVSEAVVRVTGNLKYDVKATKESRVAGLIREAAGRRPIVLAGSTVEGEEGIVVQAWESAARSDFGALLVLAPRHPERFKETEAMIQEFCYTPVSGWLTERDVPGPEAMIDVVLLDTIGDLAAVYGVADVAFVGGSLVKRGGHNPLEPAQFGVPVVMGPSYENFRDVVETMRAAKGIWIMGPGGSGLSTALRFGRDDKFGLEDELEAALVDLLSNREIARAMGERGREVFEAQQGATQRSVEAIVAMVKK